MFQTSAETLKDSELEQTFSDLVSSHLRVLLQELKHYFPSAKVPPIANKWSGNSFIFKPGKLTLTVRQEDQLRKIANDGSFKYNFYTTIPSMFWIKVLPEKRRKLCCHFRHSTYASLDFL